MKKLSPEETRKVELAAGWRHDAWPEFTAMLMKLDVGESLQVPIAEWQYPKPIQTTFFKRKIFQGRGFSYHKTSDRQGYIIIRIS